MIEGQVSTRKNASKNGNRVYFSAPLYFTAPGQFMSTNYPENILKNGRWISRSSNYFSFLKNEL